MDLEFIVVVSLENKFLPLEGHLLWLLRYKVSLRTQALCLNMFGDIVWVGLCSDCLVLEALRQYPPICSWCLQIFNSLNIILFLVVIPLRIQ